MGRKHKIRDQEKVFAVVGLMTNKKVMISKVVGDNTNNGEAGRYDQWLNFFALVGLMTNKKVMIRKVIGDNTNKGVAGHYDQWLNFFNSQPTPDPSKEGSFGYRNNTYK